MKKGNFALGALIGIVAGVVAGVLTAPKSGKQTRSDIKEKAAELKNAAVKRTDTTIEQADADIPYGEPAEAATKKGFFTGHIKK